MPSKAVMIVNVHKRHSRTEYPDGCPVCDASDRVHESHEETPDWDCAICRGRLDTFLRFGGTVIDPQAPDHSWTSDAEGFVVAPFVNETLLR